MKIIFRISLFIFISQLSFSQMGNDNLYLLIDKPKFGTQNFNSINTGFAINSTDKRFITDYYYFGVFNFYWSKKKQDIDYYSLSEMRKEINIDTINYETVDSIKKDKEWWQLHNELSLKKNIFLIEKIKGKFNSSIGRYNVKYYLLPITYFGTRKNIVPTDLSSKKN